jgi:hypothetical protein
MLRMLQWCFKYIFYMFHLFSDICCKCFIWMLHIHVCCKRMFQVFQLFHTMLQMFDLDIAYILQWLTAYVASVSTVSDVSCKYFN